MKNKILILSIILIFNFFDKALSQDIFNFDVTEAEILNKGNTFKGTKRGIATSEDGTIIYADNFEYDKLSNILYANGNVIIDDALNKAKIFTEDITYLKNDEIIFTKGRSKAIDETTTIDGDRFEYKKKLNILNAKGNVEINNKVENYIMFTEEITYQMLQEKIFTHGYTEAIIQSKYNFKSRNVTLLKNEMILSSSEKSSLIDDESTIYKLDVSNDIGHSINTEVIEYALYPKKTFIKIRAILEFLN